MEVLSQVVRITANSRPRINLDVFNELLEEAAFLMEWKLAKLILIRKPGKTENTPSSFRPFALLNTLGKLYEIIFDSRVKSYLDENGKLFHKQIGFRAGGSPTMDIDNICQQAWVEMKKSVKTRALCAMIALDVSNAFNAVSWRSIMKIWRFRRTWGKWLETT